MLTMDQIKKMSPEEQAAMKRKLGKQALMNIITVQAVKWTLIIGVTRSLRKLLTPKS